MRKILFILLLSILIAPSIVGEIQTNKYGHPFINIYKPNTFYNTVQYWAVAQDARGVMYFANIAGIAEYDGHEWREILIGHGYGGSEFVAADERGVIYVGSYNDFGYLAPDKTGKLGFRSLRSLLPRTVKIPSINNPILFEGDNVYFCADTTLFVYNKVNQTTKVLITGGSRYPCVADGRVFIGSTKYGLCEVDSAGLHVLNKDLKYLLYDIQPLNKYEYIFSFQDNLQIYDKRTQEIHPIDLDGWHDKVIADRGRLASIEPLNQGKTFAISTLSSVEDFTLAVFDSTCHVQEVLSEKNGLNANFVYHQKYTGDGQLWLTDFGISRVEIESPLRCFNTYDGLGGVMMDLVAYDGNIYVGTTKGLYKFKRSGDYSITKVDIMGQSVYAMSKIKNPYTGKENLIVASELAMNLIDGDKVKTMTNKTSGVVFQSKSNPKHIYMNGGHSIERYIFQPDGTLVLDNDRELRKIPNQLYTNPVEDAEGNIWFNIYGSGIACYNAEKNRVKMHEYGSHFSSDVFIIEVEGRIIFSSDRGLFEFDHESQEFVPSDLLMDYGKRGGRLISNILKFGNGYLVLGSSEFGKPTSPKFLVRQPSGSLQLYSRPFKRIKDESIKNICVDGDSLIWMVSEKGVYTYRTDTQFKKLYDDTRLCKRPFNVLLRGVEAGDSMVFNGCFIDKDGVPTIDQQEVAVIPFNKNDLTFTCSATFYECEDQTEYSYCLEGYNNKYSEWTHRTSINYTNLREGFYTFKVKARNVYGMESQESEFDFIITTPFYRTKLAMIIYAVLGVLAIFVLVKVNTHRLKRRSRQLEQLVAERTIEISDQKEELQLQRDEIEKREREMISSVNYASYIQLAALTPQARVNEIFPENFIIYHPRDIVSGDFYWVAEIGNKKICAVADCTGHGVPGGFLSMLGMSFLRQVVAQEQRPDKILNQLRQDIIQNLHQTSYESNSRDGMDMAVFTIDKRTNLLEFAGANLPLVVVRDKTLISLQNDKMPVGLYVLVEEQRDFSLRTMDLYRGDMIYAFSDGFADQFGGIQKRKFMRKPLYGLFQQIADKSLQEQRQILELTFKEFKGDNEQTDDVTILGIRI